MVALSVSSAGKCVPGAWSPVGPGKCPFLPLRPSQPQALLRSDPPRTPGSGLSELRWGHLPSPEFSLPQVVPLEGASSLLRGLETLQYSPLIICVSAGSLTS